MILEGESYDPLADSSNYFKDIPDQILASFVIDITLEVFISKMIKHFNFEILFKKVYYNF